MASHRFDPASRPLTGLSEIIPIGPSVRFWLSKGCRGASTILFVSARGACYCREVVTQWCVSVETPFKAYFYTVTLGMVMGALKAVKRDSSLGSHPNPTPRLRSRRTVSTLTVVDQIQAACRDRGAEGAIERLVVALPQAALSQGIS